MLKAGVYVAFANAIDLANIAFIPAFMHGLLLEDNTKLRGILWSGAFV